MKIAIHHRPGSFSDHWIAYCDKKNIPYKIVNAYDSNIVQQLHDCDTLIWHHHHGIYKDVIAAKKILFALEHAGLTVFPDFKTGWHFDDKVGQKYLLEAIGAPLVPSYVFYDKLEAINWANTTSYPKVFKLKGGAGAMNVRLVKSKTEAKKLIYRAFRAGFPQQDRLADLRERVYGFRSGRESYLGILKGIARLLVTKKFSRQQTNEKGYIYFQEFIPNNTFDTRVVVVGGKRAVAERRFVRDNDFRASGSGKFSYSDIKDQIIQISFDVAKKLSLQAVAFDFVLDENDKPLVVEISYGFGTKGINNAPGYWDSDLKWHEEKIVAQEWMVESLLND